MASKHSGTQDLAGLTRSELIAVIGRRDEVIAELRKRLEEWERKSARQASPFSKNKPKADPKRPGRKPGQGLFTRRQEPVAQATDVKIQASTPEQCPHCGGEVELERVDEATTTDIPKKPEPVVTRFSVPVCRCKKCGKSVQGQAAGLAADQAGATAHRVGTQAMATAHELHYGRGIPVRKVPGVMQALTGLTVTASAITQDALKQAEGPVGAAYEKLGREMQKAPAVHADDTSWRIGGCPAFLMGFDSNEASYYQIRYQHRSLEVLEVIPANYAGVLITDRGVSYEAKVFDLVRQQKCLSHLLKNISVILEIKTGPARWFGTELQKLLREGIALSKSPPGENWAQQVEDLETRLTWHLRDRILIDDDNQRLLNGIGSQMDRDRILTFLKVPGVDPTNNRAERMLRLAVIARKVSHCSKNERGAYASAAFLSLIQTARKTTSDFASSLSSILAIA